MPWTCTGFDRLSFISVDEALSHQRAFPDHVVEENSDVNPVGVSDHGMVVLRGPDGRIKQVTELN